MSPQYAAGANKAGSTVVLFLPREPQVSSVRIFRIKLCVVVLHVQFSDVLLFLLLCLFVCTKTFVHRAFPNGWITSCVQMSLKAMSCMFSLNRLFSLYLEETLSTIYINICRNKKITVSHIFFSITIKGCMPYLPQTTPDRLKP